MGDDMRAFRAGLWAWLKLLFTTSAKDRAPAKTAAPQDAVALSSPAPATPAPEATAFSLPGSGRNFLLAARLASVARFNTRAGRKPMIAVKLELGAKPVPTAKREARRVPRTVKGPVLAHSRLRPSAAMDVGSSALVVRLPTRAKAAGAMSTLLRRAA